MAINPRVADLMTETITVYGQSALDKYGKQTFDNTGLQIKARLVYETRQTRDAQGKEVIEAGRAICYGPYPQVTVAHKLMLPSGKTPPILTVSSIKDETGLDHHTVITFGM